MRNKLLNNNISGSNEKTIYGFSSYLRPGLDFIVAADIIRTIQNPVIERTVHSCIYCWYSFCNQFFLQKEMDEEKKYCEMKIKNLAKK